MKPKKLNAEDRLLERMIESFFQFIFCLHAFSTQPDRCQKMFVDKQLKRSLFIIYNELFLHLLKVMEN